MKIINKLLNFFSKKTISASIRNKLMMDWSDERKFFNERKRRESLRASEKRLHIVYYFHSLSDPYSHLTVQVLEDFIKKYEIELEIYFVSDPNDVFTPEKKMFNVHCLKDAIEVAESRNLQFKNKKYPLNEDFETPYKILNYYSQKKINQIEFIKILKKISSFLWLNDNDKIEDMLSLIDLNELSEFKNKKNILLEIGNKKLSDLGYYFGSSFHYEGENYWGIDRLGHLEERLIELNLNKNKSKSFIINDPKMNNDFDSFKDQNKTVRLEFFPSLNSPYTYISFKRIRYLFENYPIEFKVRPVLPMLMRNMKIPPLKGKYILFDAAREGRKHGVIIKNIYSPIGSPAEKAYSLFPVINDHGFGFDYLEKLMQSSFYYGTNIGEDNYLKKIVSDFGLSWSEIKKLSKNYNWKELLNENLMDMYRGGCWGVPTIKLVNTDGANEYFQWGQDRIYLIERELVNRLFANHQ